MTERQLTVFGVMGIVLWVLALVLLVLGGPAIAAGLALGGGAAIGVSGIWRKR